jgi:hypothetical protein
MTGVTELTAVRISGDFFMFFVHFRLVMGMAIGAREFAIIG